MHRTPTYQASAVEAPAGVPLLGRIAPAIGLFFVAPLIAEFLLGNLPIKLLPALILLAPFYGGAAVLIRESARRAGRGWPTMLLLGLAFAIVEEAFTTQSLFNPDYLRLKMHLLDPAYIPALGMGAWWTMLMVNLHPFWSIATPIALIEASVPRRAATPWLGRTGSAATAVLFGAGGVAMTRLTLRGDPFVASHLQLASAAVVVLLLVATAFLLPRLSAGRIAGWVPSPWVAGLVALLCGSAVRTIPPRWGWGAAAAMLAVDLIFLAAVFVWSRRAGWDARHKLAVGAGGALTYAWYGFVQVPVIGGGATVSSRIGNAVFALAALGLIWFAARRTSSALATPDPIEAT